MISIGSQSCRRPIIRQSDSVANSVRWCQIAKETRARESQSKERISAKKLISKSFLAWGSRNRAGYHISYSLLGADSSETILVTTQSDVWIRKATSGRDFRERLRMIQKTLESNFEKQTLSCAGNSKCVQIAHYKLCKRFEVAPELQLCWNSKLPALMIGWERSEFLKVNKFSECPCCKSELQIM